MLVLSPMRLPKVHGTIKRRLLINYRVDPAVMQRQLPSPFRPKLHEGLAIAGMCLIRLEDIRPQRFPKRAGLSSENAAHRIAVVWEDDAGPHEGVYILRRDTGSLINHLAGGRLFPGEHQRARFTVTDDEDRIAFEISLGYSVTSSGNRLDGIVLKTDTWNVEPLAVERVHSTFFDDPSRFPPGAIVFDCGLIMRNIPHKWEAAEDLYV